MSGKADRSGLQALGILAWKRLPLMLALLPYQPLPRQYFHAVAVEMGKLHCDAVQNSRHLAIPGTRRNFHSESK